MRAHSTRASTSDDDAAHRAKSVYRSANDDGGGGSGDGGGSDDSCSNRQLNWIHEAFFQYDGFYLLPGPSPRLSRAIPYPPISLVLFLSLPLPLSLSLSLSLSFSLFLSLSLSFSLSCQLVVDRATIVIMKRYAVTVVINLSLGRISPCVELS